MNMRFSELFAPTSKNNPAKVKDPNLISLIKAGYAIYNSSDDELIFSSLGLMLEKKLEETALTLFSGLGARQISGSVSEDTSFQVAVRVLKLSRQLPMTFLERSSRTISLYGFTDGGEMRELEMVSYRKALSNILEKNGMNPISIQNYQGSKFESLLAVEGDKRVFGGTEGVQCSSCGWKGLENSPSRETFEYSSLEGGPLEEVYTPGATTIPELCRQLDITPEQTMKTMFYAAEGEEGTLFIAVLIRGDRQISLEKLAFHLGGLKIRRAEESELANLIGEVAGFCGPIGLPEEIIVVADKSVEGAMNLTVGANKREYHITGACWGRDIKASSVADLNAFGKDLPCPECGALLEPAYYRVLASFEPVEKVEELYPSLTYVNDERKKQVPYCWKGSFFLEPSIAAIFKEEEHTLPPQLAPFQVHLVPSVDSADPVFTRVEELYEQLIRQGFRVLFDDRDVKMPNRLYDAGALGIPWKILAGPELVEDKMEVWSDERTEELVQSSEMLRMLGE